MPSRKPTLVLSTPVTASFPAEALMSAASVRTPHSAISTSWRESAALQSAGLPSAGLPSAGLPSAGLPSAGLPSAGLPSAGLLSAGLYSPMVAIKTEEGLMKTPLSPPVAYMDFLKLGSPSATSPCTSSPAATSTAANNTTNTSSTNARPRILHRASISGPVKISSASNLSSTKSAAAVKSAAAAAAATTASSTSLASTSSAANSDTESSGNDTEDKDALDSGPSTASSNTTDGCTCEHSYADHDRVRAHKSPKITRIDTAIPASAFAASSVPTSAPPIGRTTFPSLKIPISPAVSNTNNSPIRSPFSAKSTSITSPFDWESALKARYAEFKSPPAKSHAHALSQQKAAPPAPAPTGCAKCTGKTAPATSTTTTSIAASATNATKTSIRHIREVVTRTVTYTPRVDPPRMNAPPKGKKRKIDCDEAA
ncbi:hypothetical protein Sste5346_008799 [Sporothrix stenoceras]|uniref:Uncharacterized protein n=1 Tax=Sporothrix stenoceras TaxID=5173 RepID=A0ABR3YMH0_9PEZI